MTPMRRAAPLLLAALASCIEFGTHGGAWHTIGPSAKESAELLSVGRSVLQKEGFSIEIDDEPTRTIETKWRTRLNPHWREGRRDKIELRVEDIDGGGRVIRLRSIKEINEESHLPMDPTKATWLSAGGDEELALRVEMMVKMRLQKPTTDQ
jgi:hypothetical protein